MNKQLTFLLLFSGSSGVFGDDYQDGWDAYERQDYKTAYKLWLLLAEQGDADAQVLLGFMYDRGRGVPQDYVLALMWWTIAAIKGNKDAIEGRSLVEKKNDSIANRNSTRTRTKLETNHQVIHSPPPDFNTIHQYGILTI